jgi:Tol biopolymer transport system component
VTRLARRYWYNRSILAGNFRAGPCRPGCSVALPDSLSLVLGGEGRGEGPSVEVRSSGEKRNSTFRPSPFPSPPSTRERGQKRAFGPTEATRPGSEKLRSILGWAYHYAWIVSLGMFFPATALAQHREASHTDERPQSSLPYNGDPIILSADGKRSAYVIKSAKGKIGVYSDDYPSTYYDRIADGSPFFSPNGKHLAYVAGRDRHWYFVFDGREGVSYDRIWDDTAAFSPDGKHVVFVAERNGKVFVVRDGVEGKEYAQIVDGTLRFSPDSSRLVYTAQRDGKQHVVIDGVEGLGYDTTGRPLFSADSRRLAYTATHEGKSVIAMDGREAGEFAGLRPNSLAISPDGSRVAFTSGTSGSMRVIVDGVAGKPCDWVFDGSIVFSDDSRRVAYSAKVGSRAVCVVDGAEGLPFEGIGAIAFSPDGRRVAYVAQRVTQAGSVWCVVVDGVAGRDYPGIVAGPRFGPNSRHVAYVAEGKCTDGSTAQFVVMDATEGKCYRFVRGEPVFSPDGGRVAFLAVGADSRFEGAAEVPHDPATPAAGGKLILDKVVEFPSLPKADARRALDVLLVEQRIVQE